MGIQNNITKKCVFRVSLSFFIIKMLEKIPFMNKENNDITENVYFECFLLISTKKLKCMPITLYGETERHYQKRVFFLLFLRVLSTKRLKCIERALFWNAEEHYQKQLYFFCVFEYLTYQNHRTHAKHPV